MGYYIKQRDARFEIKKKNVPQALKAVKEMDPSGGGGGGGSWSKATGLVPSFSWVSIDNLKNAKDIKEALGEWRWDADIDNEGNVTDIQFSGEKAGDDEQLFRAIAPYVEPGSYIEMSGEEGEIWRWTFDGKILSEEYATLDFNDHAGMVSKILEVKELLPQLMGIHSGLDKLVAERLKEIGTKPRRKKK